MDPELKAYLDRMQGSLKAAIEAGDAESRRHVDETRAALEAQIEGNRQRIDDTRVTLEKGIAETRAALEGEIAETRTTLEGKVAETRTTLAGEIADTRAALEAKIEAGDAATRLHMDVLHEDTKERFAAAAERDRAHEEKMQRGFAEQERKFDARARQTEVIVAGLARRVEALEQRDR